MIIVNEFIWRSDHYAFHLTNKKAIGSISKQGLKPLCGKRSKSVGDDTKGIYFFDCLGSVTDWIEALYENKNIEELELLRFNLKNRKWLKRNDNEFYLLNKVLPEKIEYLRIYDPEKEMYLPLNNLDYYYPDKKLLLTWNSLDTYKSLKKSNNRF